MKHLNLKHTILLGIAVLSLALISAKFKQVEEESKEVLLVEVYINPVLGGMYIFHNDKPTEVLDLKLLNKKTIESNGQTIKSKFQELYKQGWELEGVSGGDLYQRYVLTR